MTIKGAPDVLISRCSHFTTNSGDARPFDGDARAAFEEVKDRYSSQGKRCILLARRVVRQADLLNQPGTGQFEDEIHEHARAGLTLVGLVAIVDPLRPEIRDVVSTLRGAGIRFFMVSVDPRYSRSRQDYHRRKEKRKKKKRGGGGGEIAHKIANTDSTGVLSRKQII